MSTKTKTAKVTETTSRRRKYENFEEYYAAQKQKANERYWRLKYQANPQLLVDKHNMEVVKIIKDDLDSLLHYCRVSDDIDYERLGKRCYAMLDKLLQNERED